MRGDVRKWGTNVMLSFLGDSQALRVLLAICPLLLLCLAAVGCAPARHSTVTPNPMLCVPLEDEDITPYLIELQETWVNLLFEQDESIFPRKLPPASLNVSWKPEFESADAVMLAVIADMVRNRHYQADSAAEKSRWRIALHLYCAQLEALLEAGKQNGSANLQFVEAALASTRMIRDSIEQEDSSSDTLAGSSGAAGSPPSPAQLPDGSPQAHRE